MKPEEAWQIILSEFEIALSKANFQTWFRESFIYKVGPDEIIIATPNAYSREWLAKKYQQQILDALKKYYPGLKNLSFKVASKPKRGGPESGVGNPSAPSKPSVLIEAKAERSTGLRPSYNFDAFVVGGSNRLAHAASLAVSKKPGKVYNPLFIYGGVGLGKTHLMQSIGNEILKNFPKKKVLYVPCERFANDFISSVKSGKIDAFKKSYRENDALLIDDVQFLAGKEGTQEEFFHTFNYLHQANKQIVLSSDRPPKAISTLEDRLKSRFEWGMIADISLPDIEMRKAILESKAEEKNLKVSPEVIDFLAANIISSIRELEGSLNRVLAFAEVENRSIDLNLVKNALGEIIRPKLKSLSPDKITAAICNFYSVSKEELLGGKRNKEVVFPRQVTMYLLRVEMSYSYPKIAQVLGKKDHTNIIHACDKVEREAQNNPSLQQDIAKIKESIYSY